MNHPPDMRLSLTPWKDREPKGPIHTDQSLPATYDGILRQRMQLGKKKITFCVKYFSTGYPA